MSTVERVRPDTVADERTLLDEFLDYHRATVHLKCAGLTDEGGWLTPLPASPLISAAGLVNHLYWVERNWFERIMCGQDFDDPGKDDPDVDFRRTGTLAEALDRYAAQCATSRDLVRDMDLDHQVPLPGRPDKPVSLRWVMLHMIRETARHNGHLDAVREFVDGVVGE